MFLEKFNKFIVFSVLAASLLFCSPARAFFPSDEEINDIMYQKYGALTSYEAVFTFPSEPGTSLTIRRGHDHWQQEFRSSPDTNSTVAARNIGQYFKTVTQCPADGNMPVSVLQIWAPEDPVSDWISIGMTNSTKSYGFHEDIPVFVFGAESGDENSPQIRFDNESFAPLKIVLGAGRTVTFGSYSKFAGFMLPHSGSFKVGEEVMEFRIEWKEIRNKFSPSLFSAAGLKKQTGCSIPSGPVYDVLEKCLKLKLKDR
ncbi:hypothetical protein [Maridesulfovibrio sp. FT414]|uniref:hypothetical protein n=1 Tax=Maridesulfovibrio sp. FT414 TaxID=2979469 RepID=UPI003D80824A